MGHCHTFFQRGKSGECGYPISSSLQPCPGQVYRAPCSHMTGLLPPSLPPSRGSRGIRRPSAWRSCCRSSTTRSRSPSRSAQQKFPSTSHWRRARARQVAPAGLFASFLSQRALQRLGRGAQGGCGVPTRKALLFPLLRLTSAWLAALSQIPAGPAFLFLSCPGGAHCAALPAAELPRARGPLPPRRQPLPPRRPGRRAERPRAKARREARRGRGAEHVGLASSRAPTHRLPAGEAQSRLGAARFRRGRGRYRGLGPASRPSRSAGNALSELSARLVGAGGGGRILSTTPRALERGGVMLPSF